MEMRARNARRVDPAECYGRREIAQTRRASGKTPATGMTRRRSQPRRAGRNRAARDEGICVHISKRQIVLISGNRYCHHSLLNSGRRMRSGSDFRSVVQRLSTTLTERDAAPSGITASGLLMGEALKDRAARLRRRRYLRRDATALPVERHSDPAVRALPGERDRDRRHTSRPNGDTRFACFGGRFFAALMRVGDMPQCGPGALAGPAPRTT